jgi:hypothetical protein
MPSKRRALTMEVIGIIGAALGGRHAKGTGRCLQARASVCRSNTIHDPYSDMTTK